jgi:hypothetical protein
MGKDAMSPSAELYELRCGSKVAHTTRAEAKRVADRAGLRIYACPYCGQWHVTSQSQKHNSGHRDRHNKRARERNRR